MKVKYLNKIKTNAIAMAISAALLSPVAFADDDDDDKKDSEYKTYSGKKRSATPAGFDKFIAFMGTGLVDPTIAEPREGITGCAGMFCDGNYFNKVVMKRTDADIEYLEMQAKEFFIQRYGLSLDDPEMEGRIELHRWGMNPDYEYRAYAIPGMKVPAEGFKVRDGGWFLQITDPDGIMLGGEFAGIHGAANSMLFFGNYNIEVTKNGKPVDEIIINYTALTPVTPQPDGSFLIRCQLNHEDWGEGLVQGQIANIVLPDGRIKGNGRNIVTFPPTSKIDSFQ